MRTYNTPHAYYCGVDLHARTLYVNVLDRCLDESRTSKRRSDRLRAVTELQPAGAGFEQERCEHEEVLAAHERNLDVRAQGSFEVAGGRHAAEPAAQHHDACCHLGHGVNLERLSRPGRGVPSSPWRKWSSR